MTRDLLLKMLGAQSGITSDKDVYTLSDEVQGEVLLSVNGSVPMPVARVKVITAGADFLTLETDESTYVIGYEHVFGLKLKAHQASGKRTGFHR